MVYTDKRKFIVVIMISYLMDISELTQVQHNLGAMHAGIFHAQIIITSSKYGLISSICAGENSSIWVPSIYYRLLLHVSEKDYTRYVVHLVFNENTVTDIRGEDPEKPAL